MMAYVFGIVSHTPWYVYLILAYLIFVGVKSLKGGEVSLIKLAIIPVIFVWMSIDEFLRTANFSTGSFIIWLIGIVIGAYLLGWKPYKALGIKVDKKTKELVIPGNWLTLILLIVTFVVKYAIAVALSIDPSISGMTMYVLLLVSGIFTGAFVGRVLYGLYLLKHGPFVSPR